MISLEWTGVTGVKGQGATGLSRDRRGEASSIAPF